MTKRLMIVNRKAPYGTVYGMEALDALLAASAFEQELSVAFLDDGVYQLKRNQNPAVLQFRNYSKTFMALGDFDIEHIFVEQESLFERGLIVTDLIEILREDKSDAVSIVSTEKLSVIMASQDVILQF